MVIVFFGNEKLATGVVSSGKTVDNLLKNNHEIAKIYTKHQSDFNVKSTALSTVTNPADIKKELEKIKPDIAVVVAYGRIIPKSIIDMFPYGILNIHPSLLPKGRGPAPIEETILDGSPQTGVSIMRLTEKMDEGPILAQQAVPLQGGESKQELADSLLQIGNELLIKCLGELPDIQSDPQSEQGVTYTHKIKKSDGKVDWTKPAEVLEREIRAYAGWPKSSARFGDIELILTSAEVIEADGKPGDFTIKDRSLTVFTGDKALLIKTLKPAGKKDMTTEEFLRGYGSRLA